MLIGKGGGKSTKPVKTSSTRSASPKPSASTKQGSSSGAGTSNNTAGGATSEKSAYDATLDQDLAGIDSQITSLETDSANVDKGLNDQPIAQGN